MNSTESKEKGIIIGALLTGICSYFLIQVTGLEPVFPLFNLPILFFSIIVIPGAGSCLIKKNILSSVRAGVMIPVILFPFFALILAESPYTFTVLISVMLFIALEAVFWSFVFSAHQLVYSAAVFICVFLPVLVFPMIYHSPYASAVACFSPLGYVWSMTEHGIMKGMSSLSAVHILIVISCLAAAARRRSRKGTE
jgi:hypothetical protein